jgi:hypothetical protein
MTFFNKKEEVIDLELTPYGEALLSIGKFKPSFYAFFDDDILYDASGSTGIQEAQNDVETRIQQNTPSVRPQYLFSGIEENLLPLVQEARGPLGDPLQTPLDRFSGFPPFIDQSYSLIEPIGSMKLGSENAPAWDIRALKGEITGAINYLTSSVESGIYNNVKRIPQLDFNINYRVLVGNENTIDPNGEIANRILSRVYEDGTFLYLAEDSPNVTLVVDEANTSLDLEYDIEVFLVEDDATNRRPATLIPMNLIEKPSQVVNGLLVERPVQESLIEEDPTFVEYFFQLNVDREIPEEDICPLLGELQTRGIRLGGIPYDCKDVQNIGRFDIYGTNATEEDCS